LALSEVEIIEGCKKADKRAQQALFEKYSKRLLGICMRYCQSKDEAEDVLQDGLVKIFFNINQYKGEGSFEGWMKRIIVNTALNNYKSNLKRYYHSELEDVASEVVSDVNLNDIFEVKDLLKIIQNLPAGYRMVFNMYAIEGYNHKEIGELLNISEGTSKSQLSRARQLLQQKIAELQGEKVAIYEINK
jgi:RNA polymerase sigma-70 factor (ECF subfamily)